MSLLEMSFCGSILIIAIIIIRSISINKLPKKTFIILWVIVLARLFVPFDIPSRYSVHNIFAGHMDTALETLYAVTAEEPPAVSAMDRLSVQAPPTQTQTPENQTVADALNVSPTAMAPVPAGAVSAWAVVWITGIACMALYFALSYVRWTKAFKHAEPAADASIKKWLSNHTLKRKIRVKKTAKLTAPLTYGIIKPVILLPKNMEFSDEWHMKCVLAHEFAHIRHFDTLLKAVAVIALCVHWFNPLVWVMVILLNRDIELRCDECVISGMGLERKKAYAHMLINMEEMRSGLSPLMSSFSKNAATERIVAMMKFKKATALTAITAVFIIAGAGVTFATSPKPAADKTIQNDASNTRADTVPAEAAIVSGTEISPEETGNYTGLNTQSTQSGDIIQPVNNIRPQSNLGEDLTYAEYAAKKAELEARDDALDQQEDKLEYDYESGKIDLETYVAKESEIDRLDDELDWEEDALELMYGIDD